jgi:SAM-dependent methyltransferase
MNRVDDKYVSIQNADFWNELCGTQLAKSLGVRDSTPESLKRFDDWYFEFYPYLWEHIPFDELRGQDVLEIGLGYGTVSQRLAEVDARYTGLDIARGPVDMVNHRLRQNNLSGKARQASILEPPFAPESFDVIVAIGCLHHTGDLKGAIAQCHKLLRSGGRLIFMVYYAYSYRRFRQAPLATLKYLLKEQSGYRGCVGLASEKERAAYDAGASGAGAPHTDWISVRSLADYCGDFSQFAAKLENIDQEWPFPSTPRRELLKTSWPSRCGLDLYATATK